MSKINIIDSIMGSGKSQYAIQKMNENKTDNFIYITPYLDEVKRIRDNCVLRKFLEPKEDTARKIYSKTKSLKELIKSGKDIATTHSLFKLADEETEELLSASSYILILDEVMDVLQQIPITKADQWLLFEDSKILTVDENNKVVLGEGSDKYIEEGSGKFAELIHMAKLGRLFKFQDVVILWEFPVNIFKYFKEVWILTYLFNGQIQKYLFDYYNVEYEKHTVTKIEDKYEIIPYNPEINKDRIKELKDKIIISDSDKLNNVGNEDFALSYSWYVKSNSDIKDKLSNNIYNYFRNITKVKSQDCLWTSFKGFNIRVPSYTRAFIPHNLRATNEYSNTHTLAYCVNRYISPFLVNYFSQMDIKVNNELFALSELLQWIFRSRIRNGEEINIYIPSKRMRILLKRYLSQFN